MLKNIIIREQGDATHKQIRFAQLLLKGADGALLVVNVTKNPTSKKIKEYLEKNAKKVGQNSYIYFFGDAEDKMFIENSGFIEIKDYYYEDGEEVYTGKELKDEIKGVTYLLREKNTVPRKNSSKKEEKKEVLKKKETRTSKLNAVKGNFFNKMPSNKITSVAQEVLDVIKEGMKKKD